MQHLFQRVFGLSREALVPVIGYDAAFKTDFRHDTPQKEVDLLILGQGVQGPFAHQTVIGVVIHNIHAQHFHELIKALGGGAFEEGVGIPFVPHPIDHLAALMILVQKGVQHVDIVLEIGVQGDGTVRPFPGGHQTGQQGVLMTPVVGQLEAGNQAVFLVEPGDQLPGAILAAVVHQQDAAVLPRPAGGD